MQIEPTNDADRECKDLIGEAYEDLDELWNQVQEVLGRKGSLDLCTTGSEDSQAEDIFKEVFEEASQAALEDGHIDFASEYVDYQRLWGRICGVLGVSV